MLKPWVSTGVNPKVYATTNTTSRGAAPCAIGMARRARNQIVLLPIVSFTCRPPGLCFRLVHKPATNVAAITFRPSTGLCYVAKPRTKELAENPTQPNYKITFLVESRFLVAQLQALENVIT